MKNNHQGFIVPLLIIIIAVLAIGGGAYVYTKNKSINIDKASNPQPTPVSSNTISKQDPLSNYLNGKYRTIKIIENASESSQYLITATERTGDYKEEACGSIYTARKCDFFLETSYSSDSVPPKDIKYVGSWKGSLDGLDLSSIMKFINRDIVQFTASGGDGGICELNTYNLNLTTGSTTFISAKEC